MAYCQWEGYRLGVRVHYEVEQALLENRSTVRVTRVEVRNMLSDTIGACWVDGSIYVDGTLAAELRLGDTYSCGVQLTQEYRGGGEGTWSGFRNQTVEAAHNADGSRSDLPIRVELIVRTTRGVILEPVIRTTIRVELPRIPRVSGLSAEGVELGQEMTVFINRAASDFRDQVAWQCGSQSGVLTQSTADTSLRWVPPESLAMQAPNSASVPVVLRVTTFADGQSIGTGEITVACRVPKTVVPSLSLTVTDKMGYASAFGGFIQGQSQARVVTQAAGAMGSTVRSIDVTCGSAAGSGADVAFALPDSGTVKIKVTVTDSRGRKASQSASLSVLPYSRPQVTIRDAYRCDAQGQEQADGAYVRLIFDGRVMEIAGGQVQFTALRTEHGQNQTAETALTEYTGQFRVTGGSAVLPAGIDSGYDCRIRVRDSFGTVESLTVFVPGAFVLLDLCRDTRAVGIGLRARTANALTLGLDTDMTEHRLRNLAAPTADADAATKAYVDARIQSLMDALGGN